MESQCDAGRSASDLARFATDVVWGFFFANDLR
jgi:hypothetical protein